MFSFLDLIGRRHFRFSMKNMYRHICVAHAKSVCTLSEQRSLPTPEKLMLGLGIAYFDANLEGFDFARAPAERKHPAERWIQTSWNKQRRIIKY